MASKGPPVSEEDKAASIARAKAAVKKKRADKAGSTTSSRAPSTGVPSPTLSDKTPLPSIASELAPTINGTVKHFQAATEAPEALFDRSPSQFENFFASPKLSSVSEQLRADMAARQRAPSETEVRSQASMSPRSPRLGGPDQESPGRKDLGAHLNTIRLLVEEKRLLANQVDALRNQLEQRDAPGPSTPTLTGRTTPSQTSKVEAILATERQRIADIERSNADVRERCGHLEREASLAQKTVVSLQQSLEERDATITSLQAQRAADDEKADLENRLKAKTTHADTLETELSKLRTAVTKLKADKDAADDDLQRLQHQLADRETAQRQQEQSHSKVVDDLAKATSALETISAASLAHVTEVEMLRTASSTTETELASTRREAKAMQESLTAAHDALAAAESRAAQAVSRRDGLQIDNDALVAQVNELRDKTVSLTDDLVATQDRHDALARTLRERDTDLAKRRATEEDVVARLEALEHALSDREKQIASHRERADRAEHEIQYATDDARAKEVELSRLREKLQSADAEVARFRTGAEARVTQLHSVEVDLQNAKQEAENVKSERSKLEADLESMQELTADLQNQIEELKIRQLTPAGSAAPSIRGSISNGGAGEDFPASGRVSPTVALQQAKSNGHLSPDDALQALQQDHLKQQLELDLSSMRSQVRNLEDKAFGESARAAHLLKQIGDLQGEVVKLEDLVSVERGRALKAMREAFAIGAATETAPLPSPVRTPQVSGNDFLLTPTQLPVSPMSAPPSGSLRTSHRHSRTEASIPTGTVSSRPYFPFPTLSPTSRTPVAASAPPRRASHARRISLNLLKHRMEDELGLPDISIIAATPEVPAYRDNDVEEGRFSGEHRRHRPRAQLGDDIVWCACCKGDLFVM